MLCNTESSQEHVPDHADDTVPTRQGDELVRTDRGSISPETVSYTHLTLPTKA